MQTVKIWEFWYGTKGTWYYYVREGNRLRRISEYAVKQTVVEKDRRKATMEFEVPLERISGKQIYAFYFSNQGNLGLHKCGVDSFLYSEYTGIPKHMDPANLEELNELEIEMENPLLKQAIQELRTIYTKMIDEVKDYASKLGFKIKFGRRVKRTADIFIDPLMGYVACLGLQSDEAKLRSLKVPMKWIYQIWVMMLACKALDVKEMEKDPLMGEIFWLIEQGSSSPAFVAKSDTNVFSFWFEYQPSKKAHFSERPAGKRRPMRPDIAICKGNYGYPRRMVEKFDLIIECKNEDFEFWESDIEGQLIPYLEKYKPTNMILASMKPVPINIKKELTTINVIDNLTSNNENAIQEFRKLVKQYLTN